MRNTPNNLWHLNSWSLVDAVWGGLGGIALLEEECHGGELSAFKAFCHLEFSLSAFCLWLSM